MLWLAVMKRGLLILIRSGLQIILSKREMMMNSQNFGNVRRNISRTSSERSGDRGQPQIENELQQHGVYIERLNSVSFSFKEGGSKNNNPFDNPSSNSHQEAQTEKVEDAETNEQKNKLEIFQTYKQMCKDIEFIQMLGNPRYVTSLHELGYFYNKDFKDYINGLKVFLKRPNLFKLIKFPEGLYNLELMLKKGFVESLETLELKNKFIVDSLKRNQKIKSSFKQWRHFPLLNVQPLQK